MLALESSRSFYSYKVLELRQRLAQQKDPQELAAEVEASRTGYGHRGKRESWACQNCAVDWEAVAEVERDTKQRREATARS